MGPIEQNGAKRERGVAGVMPSICGRGNRAQVIISRRASDPSGKISEEKTHREAGSLENSP